MSEPKISDEINLERVNTSIEQLEKDIFAHEMSDNQYYVSGRQRADEDRMRDLRHLKEILERNIGV